MESVRFSSSLDARLLHGLSETAAVAAVESLARTDTAALSVVFLPDTGKMEAWAHELALFGGPARPDGTPVEVLLLPELPDGDEAEPRVFERRCDRITALTRMLDLSGGTAGRSAFLVTTPRGFFSDAPPPDALARSELHLRTGHAYRFQRLVDALGGEMGYDHEALCEQPGQFAVRGGLVDVYPVNASGPFRIDFFGDEIESIRAYDPTTQRSRDAWGELKIAAFAPAGAAETSRHIFNYLPRRVSWFFWEPARLIESARSRFEVFERSRSSLLTFADLAEERAGAGDSWRGVAEFDEGEPLFERAGRTAVHSESLHAYRSVPAEGMIGADRVAAETAAREALFKHLALWRKKGDRIVAVARNEEEQSRVRRLMEDSPAGRDIHPEMCIGVLREGFRLDLPAAPSAAGADGRRSALVAVSARELFGRPGRVPAGLRRRHMPRRARVDQLLDFSELAEGDYLVHLAHGICRFRGLTRIELRGKPEEVISLEFAESVTLHLPLYESHLLSRYVGLAKLRPKLARLGGAQWEKTRRAAEKATLDLAASLLGTQARRDTGAGYAFAPDTEWQARFEETFLFEETRDQLRAVEETKADMERERPMDRLICGDVGFGKTEVAVRAAFKAVMDGKQVAVLVPTTVLAQQHFNTFRERMADFPVTVEMISRFRNRDQQAEILRQTREARIDILIGTHRLLSKDLRFRDLGLLVIDEEHRFGVRHKEKLKQLRESVDVVMMSATPIPRTLHLALMGARDMSLIETPPIDRLPIQTAIKSYTPELVRDTIRYEIERGGQVFYLHNRVQTIDAVALRLQELCPDLRIAVGHGQMSENALEKVMTQFVAGEYDVLVCTTIIESGLDIPNCNTIIIEGADRFGLSQLYQLRGRVGRFNRQAYCFLLLHRHARMLDQARKRLSAMRQYNQLGAGFKIAMRDLELRGAGNLLGPQQSGHIAGVGFDLYCQLLRQSISRLKNEPAAFHIRASVRLDFVAVGEADPATVRSGASTGFSLHKDAELAAHRTELLQACIPFAYINETRLRIDFYRRMALAGSVDALNETGEAIRDRFGAPPPEVEVLLRVTELRILAEQRGIQSVETEGNRLKCVRASGKKDDYIKVGTRFPRLTAKDSILRLSEIKAFLLRQT